MKEILEAVSSALEVVTLRCLKEGFWMKTVAHWLAGEFLDRSAEIPESGTLSDYATRSNGSADRLLLELDCVARRFLSNHLCEIFRQETSDYSSRREQLLRIAWHADACCAGRLVLETVKRLSKKLVQTALDYEMNELVPVGCARVKEIIERELIAP